MNQFKNTTPSNIVLSSVLTCVPTKVTEENIHARLQHAKLASKYVQNFPYYRQHTTAFRHKRGNYLQGSNFSRTDNWVIGFHVCMPHNPYWQKRKSKKCTFKHGSSKEISLPYFSTRNSVVQNDNRGCTLGCLIPKLRLLNLISPLFVWVLSWLAFTPSIYFFAPQ